MNEEMNQNVEAEEIKEAETVDGEVFEEDFVEENFLTKSKNWMKRHKGKARGWRDCNCGRDRRIFARR